MNFHWLQSHHPKLLPTFFVALLASSLGAAVAGKFRRWELFPTDMSLLPANLVDFSAFYALRCMLLGATHSSFTNLVCYSDKICRPAHVDHSAVRATQTEGWLCYVSNQCETSTGAMLWLDESTEDRGCPENYVRVCTTSGLVMQLSEMQNKKLAMRTSCTDPFISTSYGCLSVLYPEKTSCQARQHCQNIGGDLASPATHDDFNNLVNYLVSELGSATIWVGVFRYENSWSYVRNGRDPAGPDGLDWGVDEPNNAPNVFCGMIKPGKALKDRPCEELLSYVCEVYF